MTPDLIIDLFKYFAKFVPKSVLEKIFVQPTATRLAGYNEIHVDVQALPNTQVLPDFDTFVVSVNENFVSERIKNSKEYALFVEYGTFSINHETTEGVKEWIAVSVTRNFSDNNNDSINELIVMNKCFILLDAILQAMFAEQNELDFCDGSLATMPLEVVPVEPAAFYGHAGWCAKFKKVNTILI
jgi:hypothetical protein